MNQRAMKKNIFGQTSWRLASSDVELFVTETAGHLGPTTFDRRGHKFQPFAVAPWATEKVAPTIPTVVRVLRGDFFCMPFGGNETPYRGERHHIHGEPANRKWRLESLSRKSGRSTLHLSLRTRIRKGRVDKRIALIDGHNAIYSQHVISGMSGLMNFGHHATLKFPDEPKSGVISTSPFRYGQVFDQPIELPENLGYSILKPGAEIKTLRRVPTITGEVTDLSRYPNRRGFEDLIQLLQDPDDGVAWTAVTFPRKGYVWFALRDPAVLTGTVFWISNGGRHYAPWSSRHINVLGLEEVTSYFHLGLAESAKKNPFNTKGIDTALKLSPTRPLAINYIMAVAAVPRGFDRVRRIQLQRDSVTLYSDSNKRVQVALDSDFLNSVA